MLGMLWAAKTQQRESMSIKSLSPSKPEHQSSTEHHSVYKISFTHCFVHFPIRCTLRVLPSINFEHEWASSIGHIQKIEHQKTPSTERVSSEHVLESIPSRCMRLHRYITRHFSIFFALVMKKYFLRLLCTLKLSEQKNWAWFTCFYSVWV